MKSAKALVFSGLLVSAGMAQAAGTIGNLPEIQARLQTRIEAMASRSVRADLQRQTARLDKRVQREGKDRQYADRDAHANGAS